MRIFNIIALLLLLFIAGTVTAQTDDYIQQCAAVLNAALASVDVECDGQATMTACYGSIPAGVVGPEAADEVFARPGDTLPLTGIDTLTTGAPIIEQGALGIVQLTPRINYSEQALTLTLLGDVTVENAGDPAVDVPTQVIPVTFPDGANVRAAPDINAQQTGVIFAGNTVRATGVTRSGAWVRIIDDTGEIGWINATLFNPDDLTDLTIFNPDNNSSYGTMQAFNVATGDSLPDDCLLLPPSGVLLQTPDTAEVARIQINGVPAQLPPLTTLFLSSVSGALHVDVLEGEADFGTPVIAGERAIFTDDVTAVDAYPLEAYNTLANLPLDRLPRPIFLAMDFDIIISAPQDEPLAGVGADDLCTIAATSLPANLRAEPIPGSRVRHVMPPRSSANPVARAGGADGALWWLLAFDVWVSSEAVVAAGACGDLPFFGYLAPN
ncbi:MAG: SH3 domain-containing protein [Chloroflexota bacterium]